jgi:type I restriction enzyme R subunit
LKLELDRHSFSEQQLNSAWKAVTNQEITADIIAFIRQQALGSALISHEERIKRAFAKLRLAHDFTANQRNWLDRIEKTMLEESILDEELFNRGAYKTNGGFKTIDKRFGGTLREVIAELNEYLYDDRGVA